MGLLSKLLLLLIVAVTTTLLLLGSGLLDKYLLNPLPPLPANEYWGPGIASQAKANERVDPMRISVSKEAQAELQQKLKNFKFLQPLEQAKFEFGFNGKFMREIVQYWLQRYSWKEWEQRLNSFSHFTTQIEGLKLHFIRSKASPKAKRVVPLLLAHGWPGSVLEFYKLIPLLNEPDDSGLAFEIVAPSIPGYAWSQAPSKKGFNSAACARIFHKLMIRLGYSKYFVQGGDWGSLIVHIMARYFGDSLLGYHTNMPLQPSSSPSVMLQLIAGAYIPGIFSEYESQRIYPFMERFGYLVTESGYFHLQATRPDTVGHALHDSPVGLAAYLLEKFCAWTSPQDLGTDSCNLIGKNAHFQLDELLTNIMIYWTTDSITSSMRFYKENAGSGLTELAKYYSAETDVPHGVATFRYELNYVPKRFVKILNKNLLHFADIQEGGHFAALELPKVLAKEIRIFVKSAELFNRNKKANKKNEL